MIMNIIFDWSGTLSDDFFKVYQATMMVFNELGLKRISFDEFKNDFEIPYMKFYAKYAPEAKKQDLDKLFIEATFSVGEPKPFSDSSKVLKALKSGGIRMAVLSSIPQKKFEKEVMDYGFGGFFVSIRAGVHDKTEVILDMMDELGFKKNETAYVGDMTHDIDAGKKAGVTTIAVTWGYQPKEKLKKSKPDLIIDDLGSLIKIVETSNQ